MPRGCERRSYKPHPTALPTYQHRLYCAIKDAQAPPLHDMAGFWTNGDAGEEELHRLRHYPPGKGRPFSPVLRIAKNLDRIHVALPPPPPPLPPIPQLRSQIQMTFFDCFLFLFSAPQVGRWAGLGRPSRHHPQFIIQIERNLFGESTTETPATSALRERERERENPRT